MNQVFFVYFGQDIKWQDVSLRTFTNRPTFVLYAIFWISVASFALSQITNDSMQLANVPLLMLKDNSYWRVLTAPFAVESGIGHLFWLMSSFWWLLSILPEHENKFSTVHLIVELFLQNLLLQVSYCAFVVTFVTVTGRQYANPMEFASMGWDPIVLIWIFMLTAQKKQSESRLFYLPFKIKNSILVWVLSAWTIFFSSQRAPLIMATLYGAIQFYFLDESAFKMPLRLYLNLQKPLLNCSKYFSSFVSIEQVRQNLEPLFSSDFQSIYGHQRYVISYNNPENKTLVEFDSPELKIPAQKMHKQIDKWIARDEREEQKQLERQKNKGTTSIFQMDDLL